MQRLFLSIGAMKAGTTWLYSLLESHPQIQFTPEKEIHFLFCSPRKQFVLLKGLCRIAFVVRSTPI